MLSLGSVPARPRIHLYLDEDETGIANVVVTPDLYDRDRLVVTRSKFLLVEGILQNQDNVVQVKAVSCLRCLAAPWSCVRTIFINPNKRGCGNDRGMKRQSRTI